MNTLTAGDYRLEIDPLLGGSIHRLDWRGKPMLRTTCGTSVLDTACFPLVPWSNRIAHGRFRFAGREIVLASNMPGEPHPHPLHGTGWLASWRVEHVDQRVVKLVHDYAGGEWPWPFSARQEFALSEDSLRHTLSLTNLANERMPAGLGLHYYFPRRDDTVYHGLHRGEWQTSEDCLPTSLIEGDAPSDWWHGRPAGSRSVDTTYTERQGTLLVSSRELGLAVRLEPSPELDRTVVFTPPGQSYLCVEPVSHMTDALNRMGQASGLKVMDPGTTWSVSVRLGASEITPHTD